VYSGGGIGKEERRKSEKEKIGKEEKRKSGKREMGNGKTRNAVVEGGGRREENRESKNLERGKPGS
jgi:hypothetical protein